jgi:hypothetical protein
MPSLPRTSVVGLAVVALALGVAACSDDDRGAVTTTSTVPITTTTTTSVPPTTTVPSTHPVISLDGSDLVFSVTGDVGLQGWITPRQAEVTASVDGAAIEVHTGGDAFWATVSLAPGTHEIVLVGQATDITTTLTVTVVVDPTLESRFAYLDTIDVAALRLEARYAEWLSGDEAVRAAREDGVIGPDDDLENDYYIRTTDPTLHSLGLAADPVVVLQACYPDGEGPCLAMRRVDSATWGRLVADPESGYEVTGWWWYGTGHLPYWLTLRDGVVVQVMEHYLP